MKVLQLMLNQNFYGSERVVYYLSKGLLRNGIEVVLITTVGLEQKYSEVHPTRMYILPGGAGTLRRRVATYFLWVSQIREIIRKEQPDIIHIHDGLARDFLLMLQPRYATVETLHDIALGKSEVFQRFIHTSTDTLAALSIGGSIFFDDAIVKDYSGLRLTRPNVVIQNPVDEDFMRLVSTPLSAPFEGKYVLWCGRLNRIKGADVLLRAFAILHRSEVRLVLLSDGPDRPQLEQLSRSLGIQGSTLFVGFVDDLKKAQFFQHASIICANLKHPGLSQAVLEAASTLNPVVTGYSPKVDEVFGPTINLLRQPSPTELASILDALLDAKDNLARRREIVQERFSLSAFVNNHLTFYRRISDQTRK